MKKLKLMVAVLAFFGGIVSAQAAGEHVAFMDDVDKAMKISGQMASGKVPYNPARAVKEMKNIQKAVASYEASGSSGPKTVAECATLLKAASTKGAYAAKAGQGAFKAAYGDLVTSYKACGAK